MIKKIDFFNNFWGKKSKYLICYNFFFWKILEDSLIILDVREIWNDLKYMKVIIVIGLSFVVKENLGVAKLVLWMKCLLYKRKELSLDF